jgi:hypothetical protein
VHRVTKVDGKDTPLYLVDGRFSIGDKRYGKKEYFATLRKPSGTR